MPRYVCERPKLQCNAHLPTGIRDLATSLAHCARWMSVCWLNGGVTEGAEARFMDLPFKLMTSLMVKAIQLFC